MIKVEPIRTFAVEELLLTRLAFSPDGGEIAVGHKPFRTYATETGEMRRAFEYSEFLAELRYSPDGRYIAAVNVADNHPGTRGRVVVYDAASGRTVFSSEAALPIETCSWQPGGDDGDARLHWNQSQPLAEPAGAVASAIMSVQAGSGAVGAALAVPDLRLSAVAATDDGFACFGRETVGGVRTVEGASLMFRPFRLLSLGRAGEVRHNFDLGIGAGVHALSPDGKLLAAEMVDFRNNERHVSIVDVATGVEANLLPLEANTLPVFAFGLGSEYFLCMKEDAEANYNALRVWRTADLRLVGEAQLPLHLHTLAACLEQSLIAGLGAGQVELYALS